MALNREAQGQTNLSSGFALTFNVLLCKKGSLLLQPYEWMDGKDASKKKYVPSQMLNSLPDLKFLSSVY